MSLEDLRDCPGDITVATQVCVVGAGAAGVTLALELGRAGVGVCLLESGGTQPDPAVDELGRFDNVGLARRPHDESRARGLGGTTALWTGRCGLLDPIDFAARSWIPESGWPIDLDDLLPYVGRAGEVLGLGPGRYGGAPTDSIVGPPHAHWDLGRFEPIGYQYSSQGSGEVQAAPSVPQGSAHEGTAALQHAGAPKAMHVGEANAAELAASRSIRVITHAHVTEIELDESGRHVEGVRATCASGRVASVRAPVVVLCTGGIDGARLLLASRSVHANGVGNAHDQVGRHLMDHHYTIVAAYGRGAGHALRRRFGHRWLDRDGRRHVHSSGLRLSPVLQRAEGLLNASVYLVERGGQPSALRRAGNLARDVRSGELDPEARREAWELAKRPGSLVGGAIDRFAHRRPSLPDPFLVEIDTVVEQVPDPSSRITLGTARDSLGMPVASIDWRAHDLEHATTARVAELLFDELARLGYEKPERMADLAAGPDAWRASMFDGSHPIGATRMSTDPRRGVVDRDGQVHDVAGLYVASGSVFSTSGHINPTLMITTLAVRLADHLLAQPGGPAARAVAVHRTRVGLVGFGARVQDVHLPVLGALADRFEIVGFTARSAATRARVAGDTGLTAHDDAAALVRDASPDLLLVAVAPDGIDDALPALVDLGVPIFTETPVAWDVRSGRQALRRAERLGVPIGVAEQTPFLPNEQLKRKVVALGLLGVVRQVWNDFAHYDYHGVAALRALLGGGRSPVRVVAQERDDARLGTIECDDGTVLRQHVGEPGELRPDGWTPRIEVRGSLGTLSGGSLTLRSADGTEVTTVIERDEADGRLRSLRLRAGDEEVSWHNPYAAHLLTDEQIAVATLLDGMRDVLRTGGEPLYPARQALLDSEVRTAMRYAARRGGTVRLPLRPSIERLRVR